MERLEGGRFHGFPTRLLHGDEVVAEGPAAVWQAFEREHPRARGRFRRALRLDRVDRGDLQRELRAARLAVVQAGLGAAPDPARQDAARKAEQQVAARAASGSSVAIAAERV